MTVKHCIAISVNNKWHNENYLGPLAGKRQLEAGQRK